MSIPFIYERNAALVSCDELTVRAFLSKHSLPHPVNRKELWAIVYCSVLTITFAADLNKLPNFEPTEHHGYSWPSMVDRARLWLAMNRFKPLPHLAAFEYRGIRYSLPKELYVAS